MPTECGSSGAYGQVAFEPEATTVFSPTSRRMELTNRGESLKRVDTHINPENLDGFNVESAANTRLSTRRNAGDLNFNWAPQNAEYLLTYMTGGIKGATTADTWEPGATIPALNVLIDRDAKRYQYNSQKIVRWSLAGQVGQFCDLTLSLIGTENQQESAAVFPTIPAVVDNAPYVFADASLEVDTGGGLNSYRFRAFQITADNGLDAIQLGGVDPCGVEPNRKPSMQIRLDKPFSTTNATDLDPWPEPPASVAIVLTFVQGAMSSVITLPAVQFPNDTPTIQGPSQIPFVSQGVARRPDTGPHFQIYNDSLP